MTSRPLRIAQVLTEIHDEAAGPTYSVAGLARSLSTLGQSVEVHTLEPMSARRHPFDVAYYPRWRFPWALGVSQPMYRGMQVIAGSCDVLHFHGMWTLPTVYPSLAARGRKTTAKLVFSPRGMLQPRALSWHSYRKKVFWRLLQGKAIRRVDCVHATSRAEAQAVREAGIVAPIGVIPIGIDLPELDEARTRSQMRTVLFLGRLHPIKNVETLLRSWSAIERRHRDWRLRIVGSGSPRYEALLRSLAEGRELRRVEFVAAAFGAKKEEEYRQADLFVLPSHTENFGVTVAEALSYATPVITTQGTPWQDLNRHGAGWCVPVGVESLTAALDEALRLDDEALRTMGQKGRSWMELDFTWESVGSRTIELYGWTVGSGPKPSFVV